MSYQNFTNLSCVAKGIVHFLKVGKYQTKEKEYQYVSFTLSVPVPGSHVYLRFFVSSKQKELFAKCSTLTDLDCLTCSFGIGNQCVVRSGNDSKEYYPVLLLRDFDKTDRRYQLSVNVYEYNEQPNRQE